MVSHAICLGWLRAWILLICASWVAGMTGVSHRHPAQEDKICDARKSAPEEEVKGVLPTPLIWIWGMGCREVCMSPHPGLVLEAHCCSCVCCVCLLLWLLSWAGALGGSERKRRRRGGDYKGVLMGCLSPFIEHPICDSPIGHDLPAWHGICPMVGVFHPTTTSPSHADGRQQMWPTLQVLTSWGGHSKVSSLLSQMQRHMEASGVSHLVTCLSLEPSLSTPTPKKRMSKKI
jgi:hypothetical protein